MDENNETTITDELNLLRAILRSDDHLQINPSGDYEQVRIKLDHDIQISFFFDSLNVLAKPLTTNNVHDLRINKSSSKCPLNKDQWADIRNYFDELVQKSKNGTSLRSIIQSVQDHLLQMAITPQSSKQKERKYDTTAEDVSMLGNKFRGADLIFSRILHDKTIDRSQVIIGYEDRFTGVHELGFHDFKKVQSNESGGIPMHRVRHFKINGRLVWDRTKKVDTLTGSDQGNETSNDIGPSSSLVQGLYRFDQSIQQWTLSPHVSLISDDLKTPSTNDTCLPERCHFVTWNILFDYHHSALIHTPQRYQAILHTLKSLLPDVICLQEVTINFLNLLLNEIWVQANNYYIIIKQSVLLSNQQQSYGQLMLMKNFRPRAFSICPLDLSDDAAPSKKGTKELIIARFGLNAKITIDLVNLHLHSNWSNNADEKRSQTLEYLFQKLNTKNYMLIGDFNFGDYDMKEQNMLQQSEYQIHDLWKENYDLEENPGFTFDPSRNLCAQITSDSQINRRFDRYIIHTLNNLSYFIEHLNLIGTETIPIDPLNNDHDKRINQSDHYALQLLINFRTRSISHRSALVILPTVNTWPLIEPYREQYDPSFNRWPPHINLLWPFFDLTDSEDDEENILLPLRLLLSQHKSFNAEINQIDTLTENQISFMKLNQQSTDYVKQLHEHIKQLFPQCSINNRDSYDPNITIAQFGPDGKQNQTKSTMTLDEPFQFPVQYVYILQRPHDDDTAPFHIAYQLALGSVLDPLNSKQLNYADSKLQDFFQTMNLYETEDSYNRKREKYEKLSLCFEEMFNQDTLHCFTQAFLPYGCFRIGLNGQDLDTVFVLQEHKSTDNETSFDQALRELKHDPSALNNHVVSLLETQVSGSLCNEILYYRKIQALFPIIYILFNDRTKVEIFVEIKTKDKHSQDDSNLFLNSHETVTGVHEIEHLLLHARSPPIFQHLLTYVRTWAQRVGLYGRAYGYLSGYSWAILCAYICHSSLSPLKSLSSIEHFSVDEFFSLVQKFFYKYAEFNWSAQTLRLHLKSYRQISHSKKSAARNRGSMRIISPSPPFNNTGRSTINSTRDLIIQGFQRVAQLLDTVNTITSDDKLNALKQIVELTNDFPNQKIQSVLQLTLSSETSNELDEWTGWMKSRLAHFINDCENECQLIIQTQNTIEHRSKTLEVYYSIGFQLDEQALNYHRNFNYWLNKFLDQFNLYPNRTETMKISHKLISIHDWKLERMEPKPQRIRK